jgi:hypothetical protein
MHNTCICICTDTISYLRSEGQNEKGQRDKQRSTKLYTELKIEQYEPQ